MWQSFMHWSTLFPYPLIAIHRRMALRKETHDLTLEEDVFCFLSKVYKYKTHLQNLVVPLIPLNTIRVKVLTFGMWSSMIKFSLHRTSICK